MVKKNEQKKYSVFVGQILPRHYDLALGILSEVGIGSLEEKNKRGRIEFVVEIQGTPSNFLNQLKKLERQWAQGEIFLQKEIQRLDRGDWAEKYEKFLKPFLFLPEDVSKNHKALWINPQDEKIKIAGADVFHIRSSLAFGTGTHPTTQLAAGVLRHVLSENSFSEILDIGTGTGILSLVAEKYGAKKIISVENDLEALEIALENFKSNRSRFIQGESNLKKVRGRFPIIVANIILKTLIELKPDIQSRLQKKGHLILSGLLYRDIPDILKAYPEFELVERRNRKGWSALWLKSKN